MKKFPEENTGFLKTCSVKYLSCSDCKSIPNPTGNSNLSLTFSKISIAKDFEMDSVAEMTAGYTGAEIECIVNESAIRTLEENNTSIFCNFNSKRCV